MGSALVGSAGRLPPPPRGWSSIGAKENAAVNKAEDDAGDDAEDGAPPEDGRPKSGTLSARCVAGAGGSSGGAGEVDSAAGVDTAPEEGEKSRPDGGRSGAGAGADDGDSDGRRACSEEAAAAVATGVGTAAGASALASAGDVDRRWAAARLARVGGPITSRRAAGDGGRLAPPPPPQP